MEAPDSFDVTIADPPWPERGGGKVKRGADRHYGTSTVRQMPDVFRSSPAWRPSTDALVFMWTTETYRDACVEMMRDAFGFRRCAGFVWVKLEEVAVKHAGSDATQTLYRRARPGLGKWTRCEHEHLLVFRRGHVRVPPPQLRQRSTILAPRTRVHSEKPREAWNVIETTSRLAFGAGHTPTTVEMFARSTSPDRWTWGTIGGPDSPPVLCPPSSPASASSSTA